MARMPVLAGGLLMMVVALTAGCQGTSSRKPNPTPTPPYTKNTQPGATNPNLASSDPFPKLPQPAPTPKVQPVSGTNNVNTGGPSLNPDPNGMPAPTILRDNRVTQPWPDPTPPPPPLGTPTLPMNSPPTRIGG